MSAKKPIFYLLILVFCHLKSFYKRSVCISEVGYINLKYLLILSIQKILAVSQLCRESNYYSQEY